METAMRRPKAMVGHGRGPLPLAMVNSAASTAYAEVVWGGFCLVLEIQVVTDSPLHRTFGKEGLDF